MAYSIECSISSFIFYLDVLSITEVGMKSLTIPVLLSMPPSNSVNVGFICVGAYIEVACRYIVMVKFVCPMLSFSLAPEGESAALHRPLCAVLGASGAAA